MRVPTSNGPFLKLCSATHKSGASWRSGPLMRAPGSTRIFACASGLPSSSNAHGTRSSPTRPVISGATSILPSAIAVSVSANSLGR